MASMAQKMSYFMVFYNLGMGIANYIGTIIFRDGTSVINPTYDMTTVLGLFDWFSNLVTSEGGVLGLILTSGLLALFAFSLLVPTIWVIATFYSLNGAIATIYIDQLNLPPAFSYPLKVGIILISFIGISEYMARSKA